MLNRAPRTKKSRFFFPEVRVSQTSDLTSAGRSFDATNAAAADAAGCIDTRKVVLPHSLCTETSSYPNLETNACTSFALSLIHI